MAADLSLAERNLLDRAFVEHSQISDLGSQRSISVIQYTIVEAIQERGA
jgi:hypothetical protein